MYFLYPPAIHSETNRPYSPAASSHAKWPASSRWATLFGMVSAKNWLFDQGTRSSFSPARISVGI